MSLAETNALKSKALGLAAGLALLVGLAGAGLAAHNASAQSPTATATASPTETQPGGGGATPTAPTTGSGVVDDGGTSLAIPIAALAVVMLGGGVAFALASRNQS